MARFLIKVTSYMVVDEPYWHSEEEAENMIELGSRCWALDRYQQLLREESEKEGICRCYRMEQEIIKEVPADYPQFPDSREWQQAQTGSPASGSQPSA